MIECYGKVDLHATQDYFKTVTGDFDWEFVYPNDNCHILGDIKSKKALFSFELICGIRSFLVDRGQKMPQEVFLPGNDGVFNWKIINGRGD